jgi:hypothetical protein
MCPGSSSFAPDPAVGVCVYLCVCMCVCVCICVCLCGCRCIELRAVSSNRVGNCECVSRNQFLCASEYAAISLCVSVSMQQPDCV